MYIEKEYKRSWYLDNKDRILLRCKEFYQRDKELIKSKRKITRDLIKKENPDKYKKTLKYFKDYREKNKLAIYKKTQMDRPKYNQYKFTAKRRNYVFTLTFKQFKRLFKGKCYYCGNEESRGIDRVDNKNGYENKNCVPCCDMCNKMKWRHDKETFLVHINKIYKHNN